jgi:hypothetical protein
VGRKVWGSDSATPGDAVLPGVTRLSGVCERGTAWVIGRDNGPGVTVARELAEGRRVLTSGGPFRGV